MTVSSTPTSAGLPPAVRSVIPSRRGPTFTLKVVKASMLKYGQGKPVFQPVAQMFVDITETTANVEHVHAAICSRWGEDYKLVSIDGLQTEDSPANTRFVLYFLPALYSANF